MSKHPWKCSKVSNELESRYLVWPNILLLQLYSFLTFMILAVSLRSLSCWKWSCCQSTASMMLSSRLWRGQSIKRWSCCQSDHFQIVLHSQNLMLLFCVYILTRLPTPLADMQLKPWQSLHRVWQMAVDGCHSHSSLLTSSIHSQYFRVWGL